MSSRGGKSEEPEALTLNGPGLVGAQHDVDHQGELGGAFREGLDEPQHAEVVGQVDRIF